MLALASVFFTSDFAVTFEDVVAWLAWREDDVVGSFEGLVPFLGDYFGFTSSSESKSSIVTL